MRAIQFYIVAFTVLTILTKISSQPLTVANDVLVPTDEVNGLDIQVQKSSSNVMTDTQAQASIR